MWSRDQKAALARRVRSVLAIGSTALLAACFQPLYNQTPLSGGPTLDAALAAIDVQPIEYTRAANDTRIAIEPPRSSPTRSGPGSLPISSRGPDVPLHGRAAPRRNRVLRI